MQYYVGLDVSKKKTQVCIVDDRDKIIRETKVDTDPETIALYLYDQKIDGHRLNYERVCLETGIMTAWLYAGLAKAGLPIICVETRHAKAMISSTLNKNDRNDARGLAIMMRARMYKEVHIKTEESQRKRALLNARKTAQEKAGDIERVIRATVRNFGHKIDGAPRAKFDPLVREMIENDQELRQIIEPLLNLRYAARLEHAHLHKIVLNVVKEDEICRLLMTCPGVGPIVALAYKSSIDIPERFRSARSVGAVLGLTPRQYQSGEVDVSGRISKGGDVALRSYLVEASMWVIYKDKRTYPLRENILKLKERKGSMKARVALARRMAVIMHKIWITKQPFRFDDVAA